MKIIFTGGGSGGHVMPALSVIKKLKNDEIIYLGSKNSIESQQTALNDIKFFTISTGKLRRYFSLKNFTDLFRVIKGIFDAKKIIKKTKPNVVVSTGGFVSVPVVIAAHSCKVPILIHEQTIDAGLANKIAAKFATKVAITFDESRKYFPESKVVKTGIPLRDLIFSGDRSNAFKRLGLEHSRKTLYFTGGGLGCHILNVTSLEILDKLLDTYNIIYQSGNALNGEDFAKLQEFKATLNSEKRARFKLFNFINEEIADIFAIADLAVARSGAGTVCELQATNIPAIFIPLAIATNNEQFKNAKSVADIGGAVIIEEKDLTAETLFNKIAELDPKLSEMKANLQKVDNKNGTDKIIEVINKIAK